MEFLLLWLWYAGAIICALVESNGEWDYPFDIFDTLVVVLWPVLCVILLPVVFYDTVNAAINDQFLGR